MAFANMLFLKMLFIKQTGMVNAKHTPRTFQSY